jgi:hypothetical protein
MRCGAVLLILLCAAACVSPSAVAIGGDKQETVFFGLQQRADTVVFVVDMSASMYDGPRFDRAVAEIIRSLNALAPNQKFFVFFFNAVTYPMLDMRSADLTPATPDNRAKVIKWIKTLKPDNDTAPEDALDRALKLQPHCARKSVFAPALFFHRGQEKGGKKRCQEPFCRLGGMHRVLPRKLTSRKKRFLTPFVPSRRSTASKG